MTCRPGPQRVSYALSALCLYVAVPVVAVPPAATRPADRIGADEALQRLKEGNARFVAGESAHPNSDAARRVETARGGQHPFVTVVACSDSRSPVERLFDQGIGDVFVIRVAGNVCDTDEVGSIEYGVDHLGTPLLVVLGHTLCGAVTAVTTGAEVHGNIPPLVENIKPAVAAAQKAHPDLHGKDLVPAAIKANVWQAIDDLMRTSPTTRKLVRAGKLKVLGAIYDLESGKIEWLGSHPEESRLLDYTGGGPGDHSAAGHAAASIAHDATAAPGGHKGGDTRPAGAAAHGGTHDAAGGGTGGGKETAAAAHVEKVTLVDPARLAELDRARHRTPENAVAVKPAAKTGMGLLWKVVIGLVVIGLVGGIGLKTGILANTGVAGKLYAGFGLVVLLAVGLGYVGYHSLTVVAIEDRCALSAADVNMRAAKAGSQQHEFLLVGMENRAQGEELLKEHKEVVKGIHDEFAVLRECDPDGRQAAVIGAIEEATKKYDKSFADIVEKYHERMALPSQVV